MSKGIITLLIILVFSILGLFGYLYIDQGNKLINKDKDFKALSVKYDSVCKQLSVKPKTTIKDSLIYRNVPKPYLVANEFPVFIDNEMYTMRQYKDSCKTDNVDAYFNIMVKGTLEDFSYSLNPKTTYVEVPKPYEVIKYNDKTVGGLFGTAGIGLQGNKATSMNAGIMYISKSGFGAEINHAIIYKDKGLTQLKLIYKIK